MASFMSMGNIPKIACQVGFETDIGGGRENQDDFFVWKREEIYILCVLDGHGREVGKIASSAAKEALIQYFDEYHPQLLIDPCETLIRAHEFAHNHIKARFKVDLEAQGFQVVEDPEGFLLKRRSAVQNFQCVHGGTTCSIVAVVGHMLYIANVGDSTATLCSSAACLKQSWTVHLKDAGLDITDSSNLGSQVNNATIIIENDDNDMMESEEQSVTASARELCETQSQPHIITPSGSLTAAADEPNVDTMVLSADHSPESCSEFERLRRCRGRPGDPAQPALLVVYDSPSGDKMHCAPVFTVDQDGRPTVTGKGRYYKNVRKEWASLVSTPPTARFQDALAFTRSLGDLHLQTYGVTHSPEVSAVNLMHVFGQLAAAGQPLVLCLVLCSDGVWDNWTYKDVTRFVMDPSCLGAVAAGTDGVQRVALSFMQRNALYAARNFGSQADNATGIIMYINCFSTPC